MKNVLTRRLALLTVLCLIFGSLFLTGCGSDGKADSEDTDVKETETEPADLRVEGLAVMHEGEFGGVYADISIDDFNALGFAYGDSVDVSFSNGYKLEGIPYYNGYYVMPGEPLLIAYHGYPYIKVCINNGADLWGVADLDEDDTATVTLSEKAAFLNIQEARDIHYEDERSGFPSDEVFANFRSVKTSGIADGMLCRSASPCDNQHNRAPYVDSLIEKAGVRFIVDLADNEDRIKGYISSEEFSSLYFLSLYEEGNVIPLALNMNFSSDEFRSKIVSGCIAMTEHEGPYLVHCTEGKDRTGFVCMLLEALCGATYGEIVDDYMITFDNYYQISKTNEKEKYDVTVEEVLDPMIRCVVGDDAADITTADLSGYAASFLKAGGMNDEQITALKNALGGNK